MERLLKEAVHSSRDLCLACFLIASFPVEVLGSQPHGERLKLIASHLAQEACQGFPAEEDQPSICRAARGVDLLLQGDQWDRAIAFLEDAVRRRESWPESMESRRAIEDARDRFFIAMAKRAMERASQGAPESAHAWREDFERAEEIFALHFHPCMDYADLHERVRAKALETCAE